MPSIYPVYCRLPPESIWAFLQLLLALSLSLSPKRSSFTGRSSPTPPLHRWTTHREMERCFTPKARRNASWDPRRGIHAPHLHTSEPRTGERTVPCVSLRASRRARPGGERGRPNVFAELAGSRKGTPLKQWSHWTNWMTMKYILHKPVVFFHFHVSESECRFFQRQKKVRRWKGQ